MDLHKSSSIPLNEIDTLLHDTFFIDWIEKFNDGFFQQHLQYEDYIGACLHQELYVLTEQSISQLWIEITSSYWDEKTNSARAKFYGHRMLVILERVNLSYILYSYFEIVKSFFLDFEFRIKHHLNCDLQFSSGLQNNPYFKMEPSQRSFQQETSSISKLQPLIRISKDFLEAEIIEVPKNNVKALNDKSNFYSIDHRAALHDCLKFLDPTRDNRSTLSFLEYTNLYLILTEVLETRNDTTSDKRFTHALTTKNNKTNLIKHFAKLSQKLTPGTRPDYLIRSIRILFEFKDQYLTTYKHWSKDTDLLNNRV
ncbi:hypothetical protein [Dyadobacter diqingensis]|uniref:hypothetical protein n=1 Tax=Dyadobacter diqingensis TaxID=2938121 RepID=UPI0020C193B1|nr:hypothetical protein [Dyadobacter diqingensis]